MKDLATLDMIFRVEIIVLQDGRVIDEMWLIKDWHGPHSQTSVAA